MNALTFSNIVRSTVSVIFILGTVLGPTTNVAAQENPQISVHINENAIYGFFWPWAGDMIFTIDDPATTESPDFSAIRSDYYIKLGNSFQLKTGQIVTMSNDVLTKSVMIIPLAITNVDPSADTVSGQTVPNTYVGVGGNGVNQTYRHAISNDSGRWTVDFSQPGSDPSEQQIYDIVPGTASWAWTVDEDGDTIAIDWRIPAPQIGVNPFWNSIGVSGMPIGTEITLTVSDGGAVVFTSDPTSIIQQPDNPDDISARIDLKGLDIYAGEIIAASGDGAITTYTITNFEITNIDSSTDKVSGTATPGSQLRICANLPDQCAFRYPDADADGNWTADFSVVGTRSDEQDIADIQPGSNGWGNETDSFGNQTWSAWNVPNPNQPSTNIVAYPLDDRVQALNWPMGSTIILTINGTGYGSQVVNNVAPWDQVTPFAEFFFSGSHDLIPGDTVTITGDSGVSNTYTVVNLEITSVDPDGDIVYGTAPEWANVEIACDVPCNIRRHVQADGTGHWSANLSMLPEEPNQDNNWPTTYDIRGGEWFGAQQWNEQGNGVSVAFHLPNPRFDVRANWDRVEGYEWTEGETLTLEVGGKTFTAVVGEDPWDSNPTAVGFDLSGIDGYDIQPGDTISLSNSDGTIIKTTVVTNLEFIAIELDADTVTGQAGLDSRVNIWACDSTHCSNRHVNAENSSSWTVDFSTPGDEDNEQDTVDIINGTWIDSQQVDDDGNTTMFGLNVVSPFITVTPSGHWIYAWNWPLETDVTLNVNGYSHTVETVLQGGNSGNSEAFFGLPEDLNLQPGDVVTVTGSGITKTLIVTNFAVTTLDVDGNTLSGTSSAGAGVYGCADNAQGGCRFATADGNGNWTMTNNPDANEFVLTQGVYGWAAEADADGDENRMDWYVPVPPRIYAGLTDDSIRYEYSHPMATVTFSIYDAPGGNLLWEESRLADSSGFAWVSIWEHYVDLVPGTFIRVTDGVHTNELVVEQVSIDQVNIGENTLNGKAPEGKSVWVVANNDPDYCGMTVVAGLGDTWQVDFDDLENCYKITADMVFYAQVMDDEQDTSEANPGFIDGWHDGNEGIGHANSCNAYGWAVDSDDRNRDLQVRIFSDGVEVATTIANQVRDDLLGACGPDGSCGFNVNLWDLITHYEEHQITVQAYDEETSQWKVRDFSMPKSLTCVNYDIYVLNVKTGEVERITTLENTGEYNPSWSPNGKKIVHDVSDANFHALYITDVKTHVSTPLAGGENGNDAAWSPNGKWIAFDRRWVGDANLYLLPASGGTPTLAVSDAVSGDWSPNSQFLVFERNGSLWTTGIVSGTEHQIALEGYSPVWSPNGQWIAYDLNGDLWKVRVNYFGVRIGEPIQLTSGSANEGHPSWSQNGREIAFVSDASGDFDVWKISASGGTPRQLRGAIGYGDYDADYSNNGQYIAYEGAMEPSLPHLETDAWTDTYALVDWPTGQTITITIDDPATGRYPDYRTTFTPDGSTNDYLQSPGMDLKPGFVIRARSNYFTKTLKISKLAATTIDAATGRVYGVATPNVTFFMWTDGDHFQLPIGQDVLVDAYGKWQVDYGASTLPPWTWFTGGEMSEWDSDGDMTHARWHVHQEVVEVWLPYNEIRAFDWPRDTALTFNIYSEDGTSVYSDTATTFPLDWMDGTEALVTAGLPILAGMRIVVTDGVTAKETIVKAIQITDANVDTDIVTGDGPVGANLELTSWEDSPFIRFFTPEADGSWSIDYRTPSINGVTVDINPGDSFILFVRDPEKDSTVYEYVVPYPELLVPRE